MRVTRDRINQLLAAKPDGMASNEIALALGAKRVTVAAALYKLVDCGRIVRKSPPETMIPYLYKLTATRWEASP
jgi:predicted transcriptional regulator